jgi:uncharacterized protein YqjF (DUF2071 family)
MFEQVLVETKDRYAAATSRHFLTLPVTFSDFRILTASKQLRFHFTVREGKDASSYQVDSVIKSSQTIAPIRRIVGFF